jgi:hypothetical protein
MFTTSLSHVHDAVQLAGRCLDTQCALARPVLACVVAPHSSWCAAGAHDPSYVVCRETGCTSTALNLYVAPHPTRCRVVVRAVHHIKASIR